MRGCGNYKAQAGQTGSSTAQTHRPRQAARRGPRVDMDSDRGAVLRRHAYGQSNECTIVTMHHLCIRRRSTASPHGRSRSSTGRRHSFRTAMAVQAASGSCAPSLPCGFFVAAEPYQLSYLSCIFAA